MGRAAADPDRSGTLTRRLPDLRKSYPEHHRRIVGGENHRRAGSPGDSGTLPPEPNVEDLANDREGARRVKERLDEGRQTTDDLSAREYGLLAYWYPSVLFPCLTTGGSDD